MVGSVFLVFLQLQKVALFEESTQIAKGLATETNWRIGTDRIPWSKTTSTKPIEYWTPEVQGEMPMAFLVGSGFVISSLCYILHFGVSTHPVYLSLPKSSNTSPIIECHSYKVTAKSMQNRECQERNQSLPS